MNKSKIFILLFLLLFIGFLFYLFRIDYFLFHGADTGSLTKVINQKDCIELYPSNGSIKIIFIPEYSYVSKNTFEGFVDDINVLLDEDRNNQGFFSIDIINENKDKFDFYYYDKIPQKVRCKNGNSQGGIYKILPKFIFYRDQAACSTTIREIMDICKVDYSVILYKVPVGAYSGAFEEEGIKGIAHIDANFREKNIVPNYYAVSRSLFSDPIKFYKTEQQAKIMNSITFTHEMGHIIFRLADLYIGGNFIEDVDLFRETNTLIGCNAVGCKDWCEDYDEEKAKQLINNVGGAIDVSGINVGINCTNSSGCYMGCYGFSNLWRPYIDENVGEGICDVMLYSQNCYFNIIDSKNKMNIGYNPLQEEEVSRFFLQY